LRQQPAARNELPSRALAVAGGGRIAVDPQDEQGCAHCSASSRLTSSLSMPPPWHPGSASAFTCASSTRRCRWRCRRIAACGGCSSHTSRSDFDVDLALLGALGVDIASGRPYVERRDVDVPWYDRLSRRNMVRVAVAWRRRSAGVARGRRVLLRAHHLAAAPAPCSTMRPAPRGARARPPLPPGGFARETCATLLALIGEAASRSLEQRPFETQVLTAWALLQGQLVEMATGEGKTFAARLAAGVATLAGVQVHVVTVNDYLATRDARAMGPLYAFLGLSVGVVVHGMNHAQRPCRLRMSGGLLLQQGNSPSTTFATAARWASGRARCTWRWTASKQERGPTERGRGTARAHLRHCRRGR